MVDIVPWPAASILTLNIGGDGGMRIDQPYPDIRWKGVFASNGHGVPISVEAPKANDDRQWFRFVEPYYQSREEPGEYIPEVDLKEYHTFLLKSSKLGSIVSRTKDDMLVGGDPENKSLDELELCIVSTDYGCDNHIPSGCIYPNVEYRFRVNNPVKGYLRTNGYIVEIVDDFDEATSMNLYKEADWGLRIAHFMYGRQDPRVFTTNSEGKAISCEGPRQNDTRQMFQIINTHAFHRRLW
ncbi:hypothetical protein B0O80DRAFT_139441 [Mortierella sp. GBAus27b]|nr:hypothetical protein BGX31_009276 [Mortierella sp. GBA43]KAI8349738.1 hypothetical protein B0O80DRAFT_139441 [Mortierella sp. GBAus27b]